MPEYVLLLDLELLVGDEEAITERLASVQDHQIARHEIVCWQWVEANYGVAVRRGGGFTLTKEWMNRLGETGSPPWKRWSPRRTGIARWPGNTRRESRSCRISARCPTMASRTTCNST